MADVYSNAGFAPRGVCGGFFTGLRRKDPGPELALSLVDAESNEYGFEGLFLER